MSSRRHLALGASLCLVLAAVWSAGAAEAVTVVDQTGRVVTLSGPVERIASIYGLGTYYLYALGVQDRLVAGGYVGVKSVAQASEAMLRFEPRLEELLVFGDPNVEELIARGAQLLLVDGSRHAGFAEQMTDLGIPVLQYLVETGDAMKEAVRLTGRALGGEATTRAEAFIADYDRILETVAADLANLQEEERLRVLFVGTSPLRVASGEMYQTELIEAAGGLSVSVDLFGYWNDVNLEQVLLWNPDVILIPPYGSIQPGDLLENPDWQAIRAVRDGRVYRMPRLIAPMDTPVPESILGIVWMAGILYSDLISLDLAEEAARFYATYYDFVLTEDDLALLIAP
ncbi:ABC transporter substrate-binding protein [Candidatus Bipolaricaulota bacterium]